MEPEDKDFFSFLDEKDDEEWTDPVTLVLGTILSFDAEEDDG